MEEHKSLSDVHASIDTTRTSSPWKRFMLFIGPAFLVAVGYMDPGNWATDIAGGSRFGYQLLWVLLMSNVIALLLQSLSARLGVVAGKDLAQASRETYPSIINIPLWLLAEIAIAACDLAEVLGMAIGLNLLFGLPLLIGVSLAVLDTFIILFLQSRGMRYMEAFIFALVSIIGASLFIELFFAHPAGGEIVRGLVPSALSHDALYIAIGIIGATVMPHNLYLHSALVQTRHVKRDEPGLWEAIRYNFFDSAIALNLALFVNASILILSAAVFFTSGHHEVRSIASAHSMLEPLLGKQLAPLLFAIALIAAGQSSTITGTLAGQIVMEGYLDLRIAPWLRRLITRLIAVVPAALVIYYLGEQEVDNMLLLSQVILSLQLGFAVIPLIQFVSDKERMGQFAIGTKLKIAAWLSAVVILVLNIKLTYDTLNEWHEALKGNEWVFNLVIMPIVSLVGLFLLYILYYAITNKKAIRESSVPHGKAEMLTLIKPRTYKRIGICVDFSGNDVRAITEGVGMGTADTEYYLLHVVETAGARSYGADIKDYETNQDWIELKAYAAKLKEQGYDAIEVLGFGDPKKQLPALVQKSEVDLLVIAQHGHRGIMDIILGETIAEVRHNVKCPVLIV